MCIWKLGTQLNDLQNRIKQSVITVCSIKSLIPVRPRDNKIDGAKLTKLVLDRMQCESTHCHQLADIPTLLWGVKKKSKDSSTHCRKKYFQRCSVGSDSICLHISD